MKKDYKKLKIKLTWRDEKDVITASTPGLSGDENETMPMPFPSFTPANFD